MTDSGARPNASAGLPFGLLRPPFADEATDASFFRSEQHLRALEFMGHVLWSRESFGVLIAERGCGKTLVTRRFLAELDDRVLHVQINQEGLSPQDFLGEVLRQLGMKLEAGDRTDRRKLLERFLTHQTSFGRICLLIVENAQAMPVRTLDELRQIAALQVDGSRVLKLLLVGEPALSRVVDSPSMSALWQGAAVPRFVLGALSEDQVAAYIAHRLKAVDAQTPDTLIPPAAMADIYHASSGIPALINDICSRALAYAVAAGESAVTPEIVRQAITSLNLQPWRSSLSGPRQDDPARNTVDGGREAVLTLTMQGEPSREIPLTSTKILIGRSELADVCIESGYVSRYHALIVREQGGRDLLIDLGSTNAVLVNARRIVRYFLQPNDLIQIGPARLTYITRAPAVAEADLGLTVSMMGPPFATDEDGTVISIGSSN